MNDVADIAETFDPNATTWRWRPWRWVIAGVAIVLLTIVAIPLKVAYDCERVLRAATAAGGIVDVVDTWYKSPHFGFWPTELRLGGKRYLPEGMQCLDRWQKQTFIFEQAAAIDDDWLLSRNFAALPCEVSIRIRHPRVGDIGIRSLAGITRLESLQVPHTSLTDEGLKAFAGHPHLVRLSLHETEVTAASLPVLASMPKLTGLVVSSTPISGNELHQLRACPNLHYLAVDAGQLTEPFLSRLSTFPKLTQLFVVLPTSKPIARSPGTSGEMRSDAVVDDALLQRLLTETTITSLWIEDGSAITDASMPSLLKAGHLRSLDAWNVNMSVEAAQQVNSVHCSRASNSAAILLPGESTVYRDHFVNEYK